MQSWHQRKRWAQGHFDVASRYIPKLLKTGIKKRDLTILDGVIHLVQPHFLILSTTYVLLSYVDQYIHFYTNILYAVMPVELWTAIAIGQYIFPIIVLAKLGASTKTWIYSILYPVFIYSWVPITFAGFLDRKKREWSHTPHTRAITYRELLFEQSSEFTKDPILGKQAAK